MGEREWPGVAGDPFLPPGGHAGKTRTPRSAPGLARAP